MAHPTMARDAEIAQEIEDRLETWASAWNDAQSEELEELVKATGGWLERLLPELVVDAAFHRAWAATSAYNTGQVAHSRGAFRALACEVEEERSWRELLEDIGPNGVQSGTFDSLPVPVKFLELSMFAGYGILSDQNRNVVDTVEAESARQRALIDWASGFVASIPAEFRVAARERELEEPSEYAAEIVANLPMEQLVAAADARWSIDAGKPVPSRGLAALAGRMSLKSIQNALASGVLSGRDGMVDADSAAAWLARRKGFLPSLWQHQVAGTDVQHVLEAPPASLEMADADEYVFVPTYEDAPFLPELRRRQGYQIGPKGAEEYLPDYWEALDRLARMDVPKWRRPSSTGIWGLVKGDGWKRMRRKDLERQLAQIQVR